MPSSNPARRFQDILDNIEAIERYTRGLDLAGLRADSKTCDAVERCLERISEAAAKLGPVALEYAPAQPWPQIKALGNRLRHDYDGLRLERLWEIVVRDLPSLETECRSALDKLRDREPL